MIESILQNIFVDVNKDKSSSLSLYSGDAGIQLFNYLYLDNGNMIDDEFQIKFETLAENSVSYSYSTFCTGYSGINWFFKFLHKKGILDSENRDLLCYRDEELEKASLNMLKMGNYDFLHGACGIAYYLLYSPRTVSDEYYASLFSLLNSLIYKSINKDLIPKYDFATARINPNEINLGLAHGIPSILKFCVQCYKQGVCVAESEKLGRKIIDYLLTNTNDDISRSYFSSSISPGKEFTASRLAWCYGDLGAGVILYQAGITFGLKNIVDFSLKILIHSSKRRTTDETSIFDAGICHGTAGVAHIYNKMWHHTQNEVFKEACDFWIQKTLEFSIHSDGIAGYKTYNPIKKVYNNESSLLEGAAGIGLVLMSYLNGDFSWDYCLMLND